MIPSAPTNSLAGLEAWGIDGDSFRLQPLRAAADAIQFHADQSHPCVRLPLGQLVQDLRKWEDPRAPLTLAGQLSLIVAKINLRTGFTARYALGRSPREIEQPLCPVALASVPEDHRLAYQQLENRLNLLATDCVRLRMTLPAAMLQKTSPFGPPVFRVV